jgi:hypothetical protein
LFHSRDLPGQSVAFLVLLEYREQQAALSQKKSGRLDSLPQSR